MNEIFNKTTIAFARWMAEAEEFVSKDNPRRVFFFLAVVATFAGVYLLNIMYPYWLDDFYYSLNCANGQPIKSFQDIIESQYWHYFEWGGRTVAHAILQTLLWWGKTYSDLFNSAIYVIYIFAIYRIVNLKATKAYNLNLFIVVNLLVWFLQFSWGDSCIWLTGSCNYLWMNAFMMLFLYPYCKLYIKQKNDRFWLYAVLLFFAGIIVGWSHENTSIGAIAVVIILFVILYRGGIKIPLWAKAGFAGLLIGAALLFLSPGTHARIALVLTDYGLSQALIPRMIYGVYRVAYYTFLDGLPMLIAIILSLFAYKYFRKSGTKQYAVLAYVLFGSIIVILCTMIPSSVFQNRIWFTPTSLAVTGMSLLLFSFDFKQQFLVTFAKMAVFLFFILFSSQYFFALKDCYHIRQASIARERMVSEQKAQGKKDIVITEKLIEFQTDIPRPQELTSDSLQWSNESFCLRYGLRSVRVEHK